MQFLPNIKTKKKTVLKTWKSKRKSSDRQKDMIPCDFCLEKPNSAVKMCLTCEASLCRAHLNKHNSKSTQKDHALVALSAAEAQKEKKTGAEHTELLEGFCLDNSACVCATSFHTKDEYDKQREILSLMMKSMQENRTAMNQALRQLQKSADQIKSNKKILTDQLSKIFQEIKTQVDQKEKQIISDIQSSEKKHLADIIALQKQVEEKKDKALQNLQDLQALKEQTDAQAFVQDFQLFQKRIKKENFSNGSVEVLTVHLDQSDIQSVRNHTAVYISNLDTLMQVVHGKIINQTQWSRIIPAAEFSLDDVICEVFPSPPPPPPPPPLSENKSAAYPEI
ncbi:tripartite motif-containing protein 29-like [Sceloporus undulatus]|uniref:tripartite motif-containing protein 29-like n=1 Tax=Sceloporus undulatus TaxID=8520 RepID=UPI001C4BB420|nr:tripartite motif-containing protein 29-like [Sceloporus undulatus]